MIKVFNIIGASLIFLVASCHDSPAFSDQPVIFQILKIDTIENDHFKSSHLIRLSISLENKLNDTLWFWDVCSTDSFPFVPCAELAAVKTSAGFQELWRNSTIGGLRINSFELPLAPGQKDTIVTNILPPRERWKCSNSIFLSLRFRVSYKGALTPEFEKICHIAYKHSDTTQCQVEFVNVISKKDCSKFEFIPGKLSEIVKKYDNQRQK
ncbi:MAG: hypothetical protein JNJ57_02630 [Saprospiraceae bacterium]|nr:hypothetical protein [Saprospiraceae bacterium]